MMGKYRAMVASSLSEITDQLCIPNQLLDTDISFTTEDWSLEPEVRAIVKAIVRHISPSCYVEVGAHRGQTCLDIAHEMLAIGTGRAFAIEPIDEFAEEIRRCCERVPLTVIGSTSWEAFNDWGREAIDVIVIDGDHSLSSTTFDIAAWSSLMKPDGWMFVHDTLTRLHGRFPEDYISVPGVFDILDIVGLENRPSGQSWEGVAILRWSEGVKHLVRSKFVREC